MSILNWIYFPGAADDDTLLSNQTAVTSQAEVEPADGKEVVVKGREFYDKLLVRF